MARLQVVGEARPHAALVHAARLRRIELLLAWILLVAEDEDNFLGSPCFQLQPDVMAADWRPAVSDCICCPACLHDLRVIPTSIGAEERFALRIEAGEGVGAGEVGEVVAPLAILRLVVDDAIFYLDLADVEVALVIGRIIPGVPQGKFERGEERDGARPGREVGQRQPPDFQRFVEGHEIGDGGADTGVTGVNIRVANAVAAFVFVQRLAGWLPGGGPEEACLVVTQVEVAPSCIRGDVVITVARQAAQARVAIEAVAAGCIGNQAKVILIAEVIDPG